jgi:hypothetical protein
VGGLACWQRRSAILLFDQVPSDPHQLKEFDAQLRQLYAAPGIPEAIADNTATASKVMTVCDLLSKVSWTQQDRITLLRIVESLYE